MKLAGFCAVFLAATTGNANPVLLSFASSELDAVVCPYRYTQPANSGWEVCYKVFPDFKSRRDAAAQCRSDNGTLASVSSAFTNSYLNYLGTQIDAGSFWLGVECFNGDASTCMNDDGTPFVYSNFRTGEPRPDGECVYTSATGRDSQLWLSFDCQQKFQFACEVKALDPVVPTVTTTTARPITPTRRNLTCPQNYQAFNGTCYNFVYLGPNQLTAYNASNICQQVPGGMLAIIPNAQVNSFVKSIIPSIGTDYVAFGLVCPNITYHGDRSSCYWLDGTPFSYQAFYAQIRPEAYGNGYCDFYNGRWDDCWPTDLLRFDSYVNSYINHLANLNGSTSIWLGVLCFGGDGTTCINDDGTPFVYNSFYSGEPRSNSECIYMSNSGKDSKQWSSFDCAQRFQFVCEVPVGAPGTAVSTTQSPATTTAPATTTTTKYSNCPPNYTPYQEQRCAELHFRNFAERGCGMRNSSQVLRNADAECGTFAERGRGTSFAESVAELLPKTDFFKLQ